MRRFQFQLHFIPSPTKNCTPKVLYQRLSSEEYDLTVYKDRDNNETDRGTELNKEITI